MFFCRLTCSTGAFLAAGIVIEVLALETPRGILSSKVYDASANMHVAKLDPGRRSLREVPTLRTTHADQDQNGLPEGLDRSFKLDLQFSFPMQPILELR